MRIGALASHGGTNLQAIMDACKRGELNAEVVVVISNNSGATALRRARTEGIPALHLSRAAHPQPDDLDAAICGALARHRVDIVLLAGYMRPVGQATLARYRNCVLNSHPALLPKFGGKGMYGSRVHQAVVAAGEAETGVTIHIVDEQYDHGPRIAQCSIPALPNEGAAALEERVKRRERRFWVETLARVISGEIALPPP